MRHRPRYMYMTRPKVSFVVWYAAKQRQRYQKDVRVLASWLAATYWRKVPKHKEAKIIEYFLRQIEKRHDAFHSYDADKSSGVWVYTHKPQDWDERHWRFIRKKYNQVKKYRRKTDEEIKRDERY